MDADTGGRRSYIPCQPRRQVLYLQQQAVLRVRNRMIKRIVSTALLCLAAGSSAHAITIDELRGYSIQVTGASTGEFRSDDPRVPRFGKMDVDRRVYISQAGHFFSYAHNTAGRVAERGQAVSQLDQAT